MERLYHRNREPLHVVVDEADLFAPLRGGKETMRLLGAYEDIVRRGRARGIGSTSITQWPASLHTDIRSQCEVLIALRLIGTHDVAAIDEWVRLHATDEDARELKASLPSLPVGTAWVWSPGWLEILVQVQIRARRTWDSSATPKVGQRVITPRAFARVDPGDLERLASLLQLGDQAGDETVTGDGGDRQLRAQIRDLRGQLAAVRAREPERLEVPVLTDADRAAFRDALSAPGHHRQAHQRDPAARTGGRPRPPGTAAGIGRPGPGASAAGSSPAGGRRPHRPATRRSWAKRNARS
jgi:hypothetical protein